MNLKRSSIGIMKIKGEINTDIYKKVMIKDDICIGELKSIPPFSSSPPPL